MMWRLALLFFSFVLLGQAACTSTAGGTAVAAIRQPRGGGSTSSSISQFLDEQAAVDDAPSVVYPPLSSEEIGDSLRDVPLHYIERKDTGGILVAGGARRQKACYFFLEKEAAQANLEQVVRGDNSHDDRGRQGQQHQLQISTARLSQLHEKFWHNNNNNNKQEDEMDEEVDFRLVAIQRELLRARFLLTVTERDVQRQLSDEEGRRLLAKVNAQPKRFKSSYNDIPLFMFPQLRIKRSRISPRRKRSSSRWPRLLVPRLPSRRSTGMESENDMAVPLYFTFEDMKRDLDRASRGDIETGTCVILDLGDLLQQMRKESRGFDYRNIAFVPPGKRVAGTPILLDGDVSESSVDSNIGGKGTKYMDGVAGRDSGNAEEEDRVFWLRPRRRIRQQDLDALFGPDR